MALNNNPNMLSTDKQRWKSRCEEERALPSNTVSNVIVNYVEEDGSIWVMMNSEVSVLDTISKEMCSIEHSAEIINLSINNIYAALHVDDTWYRARVLTIAPDIVVQFIDFGDTSVVSLSNIAPLPHSLHDIPPLAMKVALPLDCTYEPTIGNAILLRPISQRDHVTVADVVHNSEEPAEVISATTDVEVYAENLSSEISCSRQSHDISDTRVSGADGSDETCDVSNHEIESQPTLSLDCTERNTELESSSQRSSGSAVDSVAVEEDQETPSNKTSASGKTEVESSSQMSSSSTVDSVAVVEAQEVPVNKTFASDGALSPIFLGDEPLHKVHTKVECVTISGAEILSKDFSLSESSPHVDHEGVNDSQEPSDASVSFNAVMGNPKPPSDVEYSNVESINGHQGKSVSKLDSAVSISDYASANDHEGKSDVDTVPDGAASLNGGNDCPKQLPGEDSKAHHDSFISALGRYPHLGGGYGPAQSSTSSSYQDLDFKNAAVEDCAGLSAQRTGPSQTFSYTSKNRFQSSNRFVRPSLPQSNFRTAQSKTLQSYGSSKNQNHQGVCLSDASSDFKHLLEFELSIIREQNRLQLLHIQKKMEEQCTTLNKQVNDLREDVARQLSAFRNEVNSRLLMINDALVQKVAQFHTDLDSLKNDFEIREGGSVSSMKKGVNTLQKDFKVKGTQHQFIQNEQQHFNDGQLSSMASDKQHQSHHQDQSFSRDVAPPNRLMTRRLGMMADKGQSKEPYAFFSNHESLSNPTNFQNGRNAEHQRPVTNQSNFSGYSKMEHFDPQETSVSEASSSNKNGSIICVSNLDPENMKPEYLFNLFGVYGNVLRVKMSQQDKGKAYIEMAEPSHAEAAVQYLDGLPLHNGNLRVSPCHFSQLKLSRQEFQSHTCKDFSKPTMQKMHRFKPGGWSAQKLRPPSNTLVISNILKSVTDDKIKELFVNNGIHVLSVSSSQSPSSDEKKLAFVSLGSIAEAVNAIMVMHLKELSDWMMIRITFGRGERKFTEN